MDVIQVDDALKVGGKQDEIIKRADDLYIKEGGD